MAGTDDDPNIWRLLADEYAFIAGLAKSEKLADELVRFFLEEGEIDRDGRVRYRIWQIRALPGGAPSPYDGAFWQWDPERGIHCEIDYRNSSAHWTGPASTEWKASGRKTAEYQVVIIRLNHPVVLDFLMSVGLLPPVEQPTSEPTIEPVSATGSVAGAAANSRSVVVPMAWLRTAKRERPRQPNETHKVWAAVMIEKMEAAKAAGLIDWVWSQETMERRLRDKDKDDESYQVGN
jgi:hypothetical protein